jgi:hypothetical protein
MLETLGMCEKALRPMEVMPALTSRSSSNPWGKSWNWL